MAWTPEQKDGNWRGKPSADGDVTYLEPALWQQLAEAESDEDFCQNWLRLQCRMIPGVENAAVFFESSEAGPYSPVAVWPESFRFIQQFSPVVEKAIREQKGFVLRNDTEMELAAPDHLRYHLAYPLKVDGKTRGVASLAITPRPAGDLQTAMRQLQWGSAWLENWLFRKKAAPDAMVRQRLTVVLDLAATTLQEKQFTGAKTVAVTALADKLNCDRVSIGFVNNRQAEVRAISHSAQFGKQMNLIRSIGEAMDESIDQRATLVFPAAGNGSAVILRTHEELGRHYASGAIMTIPFLDGAGTGYGALCFERGGTPPFTEDDVKLCEAAAALLGPILEEKRLNDRLLPIKIWESLICQVEKLTGPGHLVTKMATGLVALLVVFFAFAKGDYRITAKTALEGTIQRAVIAPFEGFLAEAPVRAGDIVEEGQIMAALDTRDLALERLKWASEKERYTLEYRKAMAEADIATTKITQEQIRQAEAQLKLLEEQLARAQIRASFSGLVITGDLSQSIGAPLERGEILFEIAPLDSFRVILEVDERDIRQIAKGQQGELVLNSLPETTFPFVVEKVTPVSNPTEGRNFFQAEASLEKHSERLRPGMEGFGKVFVDRRRLIWIWTHEMIDWLRLWFWSWWP